MKFPSVVAAAAVALVSIGAHAASSAPSKDIVDTAVDAGSFKTLATALQAADLISTLKGQGPFTVLRRPTRHSRKFRKPISMRCSRTRRH